MAVEQGGSGHGLSWSLIDQAFAQALDQPDGQRQAWVTRQYARNPALRDAVLGLLADERASADRFAATEQARDRLAAGALADEPEALPGLAGKRIGAYRLVELIATGGMGAVYRAERADGQFRQQVAVKILPAWATAAQTVARLRTERQILSSLQHPYIIRLLDGGETADGFPYLVTEFIHGQSLDAWAKAAGPGLRERLQLFIHISDAVQYAHQKLVIHRDLKPGNILVDGEGRPHLLDFGIAKLLEGVDMQVTHPQTLQGFTPMTPDYASPEQLHGGEITTASDIYQLGLLLFELLTGESAKAAGKRAGTSPTTTRSGLVTRPSAAVGSAGAKPDDAARHWSRRLKGDLDTIVLKALREDPAERYSSAAELAGDLRRYLAGEPIQARPESWWSATRRLARHYPLATGLVASLALVVTIAAISLFIYAQELQEQRDEAARQATRAGQVRDVLVDLFRRSDPLQADTIGGKTVSVWDSLGAAEDEARRRLATQPDILAELLETLASLHNHAGQRAESMALLQESRRLLQGLGEAFAPALAVNQAEYARLLSVDDHAGALQQLAGALALVPGLSVNQPQAAISVLLDAGYIEAKVGQAEQALAHYRRAGEVLLNVQGDTAEQRIEVLYGQAQSLLQLDRLQPAEQLLREALALAESRFGPDHARLGGILSTLGQLERRRGNVAASVGWNERMVAILEQDSATGYEALLAARNNLGLAYAAAGRHADAQAVLREVVRIRSQLGEPGGSAGLATTIKNLASSLHLSGDHEEALVLLDQAEAMMRAHLPEASPYQATPLFTRALVYLDTGRPALAAVQAQAALAILEPAQGGAHAQVHITRCVLAEAMLGQGLQAQAMALAEPALRGMLASGNAAQRYVQRCQATLARLGLSQAP